MASDALQPVLAQVQQLRRLGWREVWDRWRQAYPERHHLLAGYALAGAEFDHDCMRLPASLKAEVKAHKAAGWR